MEKADRAWKGAGGTPGGVKQFVFGSIMAVVGGYLLLSEAALLRSASG